MAGTTIYTRGLIRKASTKCKCVNSIDAVVSPQPGHFIPKIVVHRHGMVTSMDVNDLSNTDTMM